MGILNEAITLFMEPAPVTGMTGEDIVMRILCALLMGILIGLEREVSNHPAGLRTNMLVALGACAVMITAESICNRYSGITNTDPARLGAQVICGVGFLGAGTIIHNGMSVQGLTTAASIWAVACLGLAAGNGNYFVVLLCTVLIVLILAVVDRVTHKFLRRKSVLVDLSFHTSSLDKAMAHLNEQAEKYKLSVLNVQMETKKEDVQVQVRIKYHGKKQQKRINASMTTLFQDPDIHTLSYAGIAEL